jgi:membrane protein YqaA with SNARE-associated domain
VVVTAASWVPLYYLAITVSPAVTSDGHPVMPIGHVFFATVASPVLGGIAGWWVGHGRHRNPPQLSQR